MVLDFLLNNVEFLGFVFILTIFLLYKRKNLELTGSFPFLYMMLYKTRLGLDTMKRWSTKHPDIFRYISYISIFVGITGTVLSFFFMIFQLGFLVQNDLTAGGGIVLPIKTEKGLDSAVPIFYVPFWYWLLALFILVVVHEFAHGVIAERWNIKIKSSGFAFLGILFPIMPAAFVEPDEKSLNKKAWWQKVAVFGAGSLSNFFFGFIFLFVLLGVAGPFIDNTMTVQDITFTSISNSSELNQYNITSGELVALNGQYDKEQIIYNLKELKPNQSIDLVIKESQNNDSINYTINAYSSKLNNDKGMIGLNNVQVNLTAKESFSYLGKFPLYFQKLLLWLVLLNIGIGIMNLLPLWITDGGQIALTMLKKYLPEKKALNIFNFISFLVLIMIILTLWPSLLFKLIGLF